MKRADIIRAIGSQHIEEAIKFIDLHGVPRRRNSRKFSLLRAGRLYPPKYLIAVAFHESTGQILTTQDHSGGEQDSNKILHKLGFSDVVPQPSDRPEH
jgi:5-methylcytosine-specific restriction enzyme B